MTGLSRNLRCYLPLLFLLMCLRTASSQEQKSSTRHRWGPWTDWSSCSVTCGQGVAYRKRLCHNAESRSSCQGQDKQYKPCRHNCTAQNKDYRTLQCEKYNGRYYGGKRYYWEALINPYSRCELACKARGPVKYYARFQETVPDGTPCKLDTQAVCIQGRCLNIYYFIRWNVMKECWFPYNKESVFFISRSYIQCPPHSCSQLKK